MFVHLTSLNAFLALSRTLGQWSINHGHFEICVRPLSPPPSPLPTKIGISREVWESYRSSVNTRFARLSSAFAPRPPSSRRWCNRWIRVMQTLAAEAGITQLPPWRDYAVCEQVRLVTWFKCVVSVLECLVRFSLVEHIDAETNKRNSCCVVFIFGPFFFHVCSSISCLLNFPSCRKP